MSGSRDNYIKITREAFRDIAGAETMREALSSFLNDDFSLICNKDFNEAEAKKDIIRSGAKINGEEVSGVLEDGNGYDYQDVTEKLKKLFGLPGNENEKAKYNALLKAWNQNVYAGVMAVIQGVLLSKNYMMGCYSENTKVNIVKENDLYVIDTVIEINETINHNNDINKSIYIGEIRSRVQLNQDNQLELSYFEIPEELKSICLEDASDLDSKLVSVKDQSQKNSNEKGFFRNNWKVLLLVGLAAIVVIAAIAAISIFVPPVGAAIAAYGASAAGLVGIKLAATSAGAIATGAFLTGSVATGLGLMAVKALALFSMLSVALPLFLNKVFKPKQKPASLSGVVVDSGDLPVPPNKGNTASMQRGLTSEKSQPDNRSSYSSGSGIFYAEPPSDNSSSYSEVSDDESSSLSDDHQSSAGPGAASRPRSMSV